MAEVVEGAQGVSFREKASAVRDSGRARKTMVRTVLALVLFGAGAGAWMIFSGQPGSKEAAAAQGGKYQKVTINGHEFKLELALDDEHRFKGLSGRTEIKPDEGMLFVFPAAAKQNFVMRDCPIPIDIIYLDGAGRITAFYKMKAEAPRSEDEKKLSPPYARAEPWTWVNNKYEDRSEEHTSKFAAQFVIELKGDTLDELKVKEGDQVAVDPVA